MQEDSGLAALVSLEEVQQSLAKFTNCLVL